jgi:DNA-binding NarL/FixJ family response regulator
MRCLVADDHALIREGIKLLLSKLDENAVIFDASYGKEVRDVVTENRDLDFILLDFYLPGTDTLELLRELSEHYPHIPLIVFSGVENPMLMRKSLDCGASGFIPKSSDNELVLHAIRLVLNGGVYTPSSMLQYAEGEAPPPPETPLPTTQVQSRDSSILPGRRKRVSLTERQLEVLKLISLGKTNREIAEALDLSANTVKVHITAIMQVLQTTNRTEAVIVAREKGLF